MNILEPIFYRMLFYDFSLVNPPRSLEYFTYHTWFVEGLDELFT